MGLDNPIHIVFLLMLLLLVFGARRLPELGRSLGTGMRGFKESLTGEDTRAALPSAPEAGQRVAQDIAQQTQVAAHVRAVDAAR